MMKEDTVLTPSSTPPSDAEVIDLDPKALEAGWAAMVRAADRAVTDDLYVAFQHGIKSYQSSASKAALPDEVKEVVKRLNAMADAIGEPADEMEDEDLACLRSSVTLLSALASRAQTAEAVAAKSSGRPPATNADESGRATEDDGATKSGAMISASPVAGKGNG